MRYSNWFPELAIMEITFGNNYLDSPMISPLLWETPCYCPVELQLYDSSFSVPSVGNFTACVVWPLIHLANILYLFVIISYS